MSFVYEEPMHRLRQDLIYRLRWNIFGPLDDICVVEPGAGDTARLEPFQGQAIASYPLADPPLNRIMVYIDECEEKAVRDDNEEQFRYQPPPPITIQCEDGAPLTLMDFVIGVHQHLNANKAAIVEAKDEVYAVPSVIGDGILAVDVSSEGPTRGNIAEGTEFFSDQAGINVDEEDALVSVCSFAVGDLGTSLETFWETKQRFQSLHEARRARNQTQ